MSKRYILTLMAANRVGIMSAVTTGLGELGANLVEVSQTVLQQYFTIILAADFPDQRTPEVIVDHLHDYCRPFNVEICIKSPEEDELQEAPAESSERYYLTITGNDHPGMIREISSRISQECIDISDLYARRTEEGSFAVMIELVVPAGVDAIAFQKELEEIGSVEGLQASLQHENIFDATNSPRPVRFLTRHASHSTADQ